MDTSDTKPTTQTVLQQRIRERLEDLRRSARDVSLSAGLGPDAVRTILSGRSKSPRAENLAALARELQCEVSYLLGETRHPSSIQTMRHTDEGQILGTHNLQISYNLSFEFGKITDQLFNPEGSADDQVYVSDIMSLNDYSPTTQTLEFVKDDHANLIAPRGSYLHCLTFGPAAEVTLKDNDVVIVERLEFERGGAQRTARRVRFQPDRRVALQTMTSDPDLHDRIELEALSSGGVPASTLDRASGRSIVIAALVLRAIVPLGGPSVLSFSSRRFA